MMAHFTIQAQCRGPGIGFFHALSDVGPPLIPGRAAYQEPDQEYWLEGSGRNIWFGEDSFSFL